MSHSRHIQDFEHWLAAHLPSTAHSSLLTVNIGEEFDTLYHGYRQQPGRIDSDERLETVPILSDEWKRWDEMYMWHATDNAFRAWYSHYTGTGAMPNAESKPLMGEYGTVEGEQARAPTLGNGDAPSVSQSHAPVHSVAWLTFSFVSPTIQHRAPLPPYDAPRIKLDRLVKQTMRAARRPKCIRRRTEPFLKRAVKKVQLASQ
eukprot:m.301747 g.301747  ORF g.301747 m.301747 type:complete len:203 (-) comp15880_c0_seq2:2895-3503(-)